MKKILIIGKGGQVSENLIGLLKNNKSFEFLALGQNELDLSKPQEIYPKLSATGYKPDVIINAAAYTAVDTAEDERTLCDNINNVSVREIAKFATKTQALLIHYSTDYVFDGAGTAEFTEDNTYNLNPLNHYGVTKLAGEKEVIKSGCNHLILRTSWVYNDAGKNFVLTMLKLGAEREELKIVADQVGSPTCAFDIADYTIKIIEKYKGQSGIYHFVAPQKVSWFEFTQMIFDNARALGFNIKVKNVLPIKTSDYPTKAKRSHNSRLSTAKLERDFGLQFPKIEDSLMICLKKIRDKI